jgi:cobalt/nickel transport system ATP-binding protein
LGIAHLKDRPPFRLSVGEKRAAAIATVLSMQPDILVMDEPTTALDPRSRKRVMSLLEDFEQTKIIAGHDLDMVMKLCDRAIVTKDGKVAADGAAEAILTDEKLMDSCGLEATPVFRGCPVCEA